MSNLEKPKRYTVVIYEAKPYEDDEYHQEQKVAVLKTNDGNCARLATVEFLKYGMDCDLLDRKHPRIDYELCGGRTIYHLREYPSVTFAISNTDEAEMKKLLLSELIRQKLAERFEYLEQRGELTKTTPPLQTPGHKFRNQDKQDEIAAKEWIDFINAKQHGDE